MIDPDIELIHIVARWRRRNVGPTRRVDRRHKWDEESCLRRDGAGRNLVAGDRLAGERVLQLWRSGKIAASLRCRRNDRILSQAVQYSSSLVIDKEERLVP